MNSNTPQPLPVSSTHQHYHADEYQKALFTPELNARPTVYVVDDDESTLLGLASLLAASGYHVEAFRSALAFLDLPIRRPGCIVLDVLMPELTGSELQRRLVSSDDPLPIVFLSGCNDIPTAVEVMKAGAIDFLRKPIVADDLLEAVARAVEVDRSRQAGRVDRARQRERLARLTVREKEVLQEVVQGLLNKQVGARLGITERTVKRHRGMVMHKLGVGSVAELVRFADRVVADRAIAGHADRELVPTDHVPTDHVATDRLAAERVVHDGSLANRSARDHVAYDRVAHDRAAHDRVVTPRVMAEHRAVDRTPGHGRM